MFYIHLHASELQKLATDPATQGAGLISLSKARMKWDQGQLETLAPQSVVCRPAVPKAGWKCQFPIPTLDLQNQNLHLHKIPEDSPAH